MDDPIEDCVCDGRFFAGWSPKLLMLIEKSHDVFLTRPIHYLPTDFQWANRPGVTLVGDAAHLMPPVGLGVNLAMLDAAEMAVAISQSENWIISIARQEVAMLTRAHEAAPEALAGFASMFADDAPAGPLHHMQTRREADRG